MKHFALIFIFLLALTSCSNNSSSHSPKLSDIEPTEEFSERMMPHLIDMEREQFRFNLDTYNQIDSLLLATLQVENDNNMLALDPQLFDFFLVRIENLMNEMGDLEHDSHSVLMEYCHPLRELVEEANNSENREVLLTRTRDIQVYLLNFRQLFPEIRE